MARYFVECPSIEGLSEAFLMIKLKLGFGKGENSQSLLHHVRDT
jgi:hypothetical protein